MICIMSLMTQAMALLCEQSPWGRVLAHDLAGQMNRSLDCKNK